MQVVSYLIQQIYPGPFNGNFYASGKNEDDRIVWTRWHEKPPLLFPTVGEASDFITSKFERFAIKRVTIMDEPTYAKLETKAELLDSSLNILLQGRKID